MTKREPWPAVKQRLLASGKTDFASLVKLAGLDPARHMRFSEWSGVDFEGSDLRGFDFTGARIHNGIFAGARIDGARFDQALIDGTNLREAVNWDAYVRNWQRPAKAISDDHLPISAVFQDAPFGPEMMVVPPGSFLMGSPPDEPERTKAEGPQHEVTIAYPLAVGRYAVTFDEWDFAQDDKDWHRITGVKKHKPDDRGWGRGDRPVINVSWDHAQAYVKWLREKTGKAYRLLSEAEWEYVCRAGTSTPFWWGPSITPDQANYDGNFVYKGGGQEGEWRQKTLPVRSFEPNPWGLYQVHGNVWEWCEDVLHENYDGAPDDGGAWTDGRSSSRVLRGGSWVSLPQGLRAAYRSRVTAVYRSDGSGFRLARTLTS